MWSSEQDSNTTATQNPRTSHTTPMGTSNSSSSPRSSLSSSNGCSMIFPQTPRRSMEDVWKDISLMTPLQNQYHQHHHHHHHQYNHHHQSHHHQNHFQLPNPANGSYKGMILQDFLAGPSNRSLAVSPAPGDHTAAAAAATFPPIIDIAPNLPPTSLSLNSGLDFGCLGNSPSSNSSSGDSKAGGGHRATETSFVSPANYPDMIMDPSSPVNILSFYSKKRVPDGPPVGGDRRQKRMIKNRESAARSRARKQAYTSMLEQNVNNLTQENEMLQNQCNELRLAMEGQQSTRRSLQRCGSCSF